MLKKRENLEKAKSWFDLSKYEPQRKLLRRDWGQQIGKRAHYLAAVENFISFSDDSIEKVIAFELVSKLVDELSREPLSDWSRNRGKNPVEPISLVYMQQLQDLVAKFNQFAPAMRLETYRDFAVPVDDLMRWEGNPLGHLRINLFARDADILRSFEKWLASRRASFASEISRKSIRAASEIEWQNSGLLPFADLRIWEKFTGYALTEQDRINLVFPDWQGDYRGKHEVAKKAFDTYLNLAHAMSMIFGVDD